MYKYPEGVTHITATVKQLTEMMQYYFDHYPRNPEQGALRTFAQKALVVEQESKMVPNTTVDALITYAQERANALNHVRYIADLIWCTMNRHQSEFAHRVREAIGYYSANRHWQTGYIAGWNRLDVPSAPDEEDARQIYFRGLMCGKHTRKGVDYWDDAEHELQPWIRGFCSGSHTPGFGNMNPYSNDSDRIDWDAGWIMGNELYHERES